jgi:GxxExxY protein
VSADPRTEPVLNAAFFVHSALGPGLLEAVYEACLERVLLHRGHQVQRQVRAPLQFDGLTFDTGYRMDLVVDRAVVVEVKAVERVLPVHHAQLLTYLEFSGLTVGLLLNFNVLHLRDGITRRVLNHR